MRYVKVDRVSTMWSRTTDNWVGIQSHAPYLQVRMDLRDSESVNPYEILITDGPYGYYMMTVQEAETSMDAMMNRVRVRVSGYGIVMPKNWELV